MISYKEYISTNETQNLRFYRDMIDLMTKNENINQQTKPNKRNKTQHREKNKYDHTMNINII